MSVDQDMLIAYALGTLTPAEAREVERYLKTHSEAASEVRDYLEALSVMVLTQDLTEEPADLPADAEGDLLARIHTSPAAPPPTVPRRPARRWWLGLALAVAVAVWAWLGIFQPRFQIQQAQHKLHNYCASAQATCQQLVSATTQQPLGTMARFKDNRLYVLFNKPPPAGKVYQGWDIVGGKPQPLHVSSNRVLNIQQPLQAGSTFGVTLEPPGGSPRPTSQPIVAVPL
jgi:anti-sigma-K factor RskA